MSCFVFKKSLCINIRCCVRSSTEVATSVQNMSSMKRGKKKRGHESPNCAEQLSAWISKSQQEAQNKQDTSSSHGLFLNWACHKLQLILQTVYITASSTFAALLFPFSGQCRESIAELAKAFETPEMAAAAVLHLRVTGSTEPDRPNSLIVAEVTSRLSCFMELHWKPSGVYGVCENFKPCAGNSVMADIKTPKGTRMRDTRIRLPKVLAKMSSNEFLANSQDLTAAREALYAGLWGTNSIQWRHFALFALDYAFGEQIQPTATLMGDKEAEVVIYELEMKDKKYYVILDSKESKKIANYAMHYRVPQKESDVSMLPLLVKTTLWPTRVDEVAHYLMLRMLARLKVTGNDGLRYSSQKLADAALAQKWDNYRPDADAKSKTETTLALAENLLLFLGDMSPRLSLEMKAFLENLVSARRDSLETKHTQLVTSALEKYPKWGMSVSGLAPEVKSVRDYMEEKRAGKKQKPNGAPRNEAAAAAVAAVASLESAAAPASSNSASSHSSKSDGSDLGEELAASLGIVKVYGTGTDIQQAKRMLSDNPGVDEDEDEDEESGGEVMCNLHPDVAD